MARVDGSQNEAYYLRLHMLIMEAQKVLRAKFDSIIKPADLPNTLVRAKGTLDQLKRDGIISNEQYKLLKPNPDSGTFDATLLTCLLQNICNLNPKDKVWFEKDNTKINGDIDQENIQRIRNLRNKMQHQNVASLDQQDFQSSWNVLEKAMVNLGTSCGLHDIQDKINITRTRSLDKVLFHKYQENKKCYFQLCIVVLILTIICFVVFMCKTPYVIRIIYRALTSS